MQICWKTTWKTFHVYPYFNNELNITFHIPKRCDTCKLLEKSNPESIDQAKYQEHVHQKKLNERGKK